MEGIVCVAHYITVMRGDYVKDPILKILNSFSLFLVISFVMDINVPYKACVSRLLIFYRFVVFVSDRGG